MVSQTTEAEYKSAKPAEKPVHLFRKMGRSHKNDSLTGLSAIAIKSMQIAEDKASQNNGDAMRRQAELQRIIEQYFNQHNQ